MSGVARDVCSARFFFDRLDLLESGSFESVVRVGCHPVTLFAFASETPEDDEGPP